MDCLRRAGYHLVICSVRLLNAAAVAAQRRIDVTGWLCAFAIGAVLGVWVFTGLDAIRVREPVPLTGRWARLRPTHRPSVHPELYRVLFDLPGRAAARGTVGAAAKPNAVARNLWRVCSIAIVPLIIGPLYVNIGQRARPAKAQADTRAIASAISVYVSHCGGLPADSSDTDCPVVAEPGGPYLVPRSLLFRQTSAQGQIGGPFLNSIPELPANWTGAGRSYAYHIFPRGKFLICAQGEGTAANSQGGWSCP
jgi:hypothetical protein